MYWCIIKLVHVYFLWKKVMAPIARLRHLRRRVTELTLLAELKAEKLDDNKTYTMLILSGLSKLVMKEIESMHLSSET